MNKHLASPRVYKSDINLLRGLYILDNSLHVAQLGNNSLYQGYLLLTINQKAHLTQDTILLLLLVGIKTTSKK